MCIRDREGAALYGCIQQIKKVKRPGVSLLEWSKHSRQSELVVILAEDTAALLGLFFALIAVVLTAITGNPIYDALGSIAIGVLLLFVSIFLGKKVKGLLVGQSAEKGVRDEIDAILESRPEIAEIFSVITLQPVSYTHLDVYKRQAIARAWPTPLCYCQRLIIH